MYKSNNMTTKFVIMVELSIISYNIFIYGGFVQSSLYFLFWNNSYQQMGFIRKQNTF